MTTRTGVMSSATPALDLYNLIAADLAANPNWSRPVDPTLTGSTDSYGVNHTSQVWKCTVGSSSFHLVLSYDSAVPTHLIVTLAELYGAADGCAAKRFRRIPGGGTTNTTTDAVAITPGATDVVTNSDTALPSTSPYFMACVVTLSTSGSFSYLYRVSNKTVTISARTTTNQWCHAGAFESLVTGPADPMPIGMFADGDVHGVNRNIAGGNSLSAHVDGVVTRNPGLGTGAETGAFMAQLQPLHAHAAFGIGGGTDIWTALRSHSSSPGRWFNKMLMSQAVIHQSRDAGSSDSQGFRGYYPELYAGILNGSTAPFGGGVDSVIIDGVTYYWLGINCTGQANSGPTSGHSVLVAVRGD